MAQSEEQVAVGGGICDDVFVPGEHGEIRQGDPVGGVEIRVRLELIIRRPGGPLDEVICTGPGQAHAGWHDGGRNHRGCRTEVALDADVNTALYYPYIPM